MKQWLQRYIHRKIYKEELTFSIDSFAQAIMRKNMSVMVIRIIPEVRVRTIKGKSHSIFTYKIHLVADLSDGWAIVYRHALSETEGMKEAATFQRAYIYIHYACVSLEVKFKKRFPSILVWVFSLT